MENTARWTIKVSRDTDISLRTYLAQQGMKKGDLSKFIERAVQKEILTQTAACRFVGRRIGGAYRRSGERRARRNAFGS
jgi:hypothetical protein